MRAHGARRRLRRHRPAETPDRVYGSGWVLCAMSADHRAAHALGRANDRRIFDAARREYLIGSEAARDCLVPYSFVFSVQGAVPYEWADGAVPLNRAELAEAWEFLARLNALVVAECSELPIPLGVTIDHRFKKSIFDRQIFSFAETSPAEKGEPFIVRALVE